MKPSTAFRIAMAVLVTLPAWSMAAATIGVLTIADGEVVVLRDAQRLTVAEGFRLRADDIVRTAADTRLVRVELDDGVALDFGPGTQAMLRPRFIAAAERADTVYLLQGWAKLSRPVASAAPVSPALVRTPRLDAARIAGIAVAHTARGTDWLFVESGSATAVARHEAPGAAAQELADGDSYAQRDTEPGRATRRAPADLLAQLPRAFADSLPRRAQRLAAASAEPVAVAEVGYDEFAPWLNGEPALRAAFVTRLAALSQQARFRQGLVADLALHPEWRRVLFPEPVRAKAPTTVARHSSPPLPRENRPATADAQWRVQVEPLAAEPAGPTALASAPAEAGAPADIPPPAEPPARGDTP